MGLFKKGFEAVKEEKQRQDENREKMGKQLWRFFLSEDGDDADIRFLTEEPINFYEHSVKTMKGGKERYDNVMCTSALGECALCDDDNRSTFKGAFLIFDKRPYEYTDANGKKKSGEGQLRLYIQGARVLSQLDRLSSKYGLTNRDYTITRSGSGTATTYMFDRGDAYDLSSKEISNMLPEKLREDYDGTMNSLYAIIEKQLEMMIKGFNDDDDEEDDEPKRKKNDKLVNIDDEEDEAPPKKSRPLFKNKGVKKPIENKVKSFLKKTFVEESEDDDLPF